jgi:xanthine dehydrogenase accessory factor
MSGWAAPDRAVAAAARERLDAGEAAMLATVVAVDGHAYRRPGARTVVTPGEGATGAITAGCLTDRVERLAETVLADGPRLERFDLTDDGDAWGLGVGCNGVIDLLCEPLGERHRPLVADADATTAVVVESADDRLAVGERASLDGEPSVTAAFPESVATAVRDATADREGAFVTTVEAETDRGPVALFVERVTAPPHLLVVGSGQDVRPVVELARNVDFRVTVVGFRGAAATPERFPDADRVVATSPRDLREAVSIDGDTYAVVMTHNFVDDRLAVAELLATDAPYVGLMGPPDRFERLREAIDGDPLPPDADDRLYTPVGLDLGGGTPYQVAHSVVAEALAVANGRSGGHLRASDRSIHADPTE